MEISQLGLFALFLNSVIGGVALGVIYEMARGIRLILKMIIVPWSLPSAWLFGKELVFKYCRDFKKSRTDKLGQTVLYGVTVLLDLIFMSLAAALVILMSYAGNGGRMRWMIYIGFFLGAFLYMATFGRFFKNLLLATVIFIGNTIVALLKLVSVPAKNIKCKTKSILSKFKKSKPRKSKIKRKIKEDKRRKG